VQKFAHSSVAKTFVGNQTPVWASTAQDFDRVAIAAMESAPMVSKRHVSGKI